MSALRNDQRLLKMTISPRAAFRMSWMIFTYAVSALIRRRPGVEIEFRGGSDG